MVLFKMKAIFKRNRKVYAPLYSREMVITPQQQEQLIQRGRIIDALDEITDRGIPITEDEVAEAVAKAIDENCRRLNEMATKKPKPHTCTQCGAPLKDGKCEYCGTEYN